MENIAYAIPVLLLSMWLENKYAISKGLKFYEFKDTISNISIGILDRILGLLCAGLFYFIYDFLYQHFAFSHIPQNWYTWLIIFFAVDFLYYWYHRASHEVNLFWAVHVVHHSSNEYNYSVGTRVTILQSIMRMVFFIILPVIGFKANMIVLMLLIQGVIPFFVHTRFVKKMPAWFEFIFVTPAHHRVHHGRNETYLDKNYGGVLIIWDRIFNTFTEETEDVQFGLTKPMESKSLLWQLFHFILELSISVKNANGIVNKFKVLFGKPEVIQADLRETLEDKFLTPKPIAKSNLTDLFKNYVVLQLSVSIVALLFMLYFYDTMNTAIMWFSSVILIITLINCGAILEQKTWVFYLEYLRFVLSLAFIIYLFPVVITYLFTFLLFVASILFFSKCKISYNNQLIGNSF